MIFTMIYYLFLNPNVSLASAFFIFPILYFIFIDIIYLTFDSLLGPAVSLPIGIYSVMIFWGLWCYEVWEHAANSQFRSLRALARFFIIYMAASWLHLAHGILDLIEEGKIGFTDFSYIEEETMKLIQNMTTKKQPSP